jgi:hypothetical protein
MIGAGHTGPVWRWHRHPDRRPVGSRRSGQRFASYQLDRWPIFAKKVCCLVKIESLHSNAAGLPAVSAGNLKVKIEIDSFGVFRDRAIIVAHLVSPTPGCVAHPTFMIPIFVGRDCGALGFVDRAHRGQVGGGVGRVLIGFTQETGAHRSRTLSRN